MKIDSGLRLLLCVVLLSLVLVYVAWRERGAASGSALLLETGSSPTGSDPAPPRTSAPSHPDAEADPTVVTVEPGVHAFVDLHPAPVYLVETNDGFVMIDAGFEEHHDTIVRGIIRLGLHLDQLRAILLTHAHGDHTLGAMRWKQETGAEIYAGAGDADVLRQGRPYEAIFSKWPMPDQRIHPTVVDVELPDDQLLNFGDVEIRAIATSGHTPGSMCYLLVRGGLRALFAGDVILSPNELGTYSTYLPPRFRGNAADYCRSIRKLLALEAPDLLLPGHPADPGGLPLLRDPEFHGFRISPRDWEALLTSGLREMEVRSSRLQADGADFLDGASKELLPGVYYFGEIEGLSLYAAVVSSQLVLFDAPGGDALPATLKSRLAERGLNLADVRAVLLSSRAKEATSGLAALVRETGCQVVVAQAARESVLKLCPEGTEVASVEDFASATRGIGSLALYGPRSSTTVYELLRDGKRVLISGQALMTKDLSELHATSNRTRRDLSGDELVFAKDREAMLHYLAQTRGDVHEFVRAVERLLVEPCDVWLPLKPAEFQNANLYDDEWVRILRYNERLVRNWARKMGR